MGREERNKVTFSNRWARKVCSAWHILGLHEPANFGLSKETIHHFVSVSGSWPGRNRVLLNPFRILKGSCSSLSNLSGRENIQEKTFPIAIIKWKRSQISRSNASYILTTTEGLKWTKLWSFRRIMKDEFCEKPKPNQNNTAKQIP